MEAECRQLYPASNELLESVGFPVAMENAKPEIYAMCQNHTERVERTLRELLAGI